MGSDYANIVLSQWVLPQDDSKQFLCQQTDDTLVALNDESKQTGHSTLSVPMLFRLPCYRLDVRPHITSIFSPTFEKRELEFSCTNNYDRIFRVLSIEFISSRRRDGPLRLIDGELANRFDLGPNEKRLLKFEVQPQEFGVFALNASLTLLFAKMRNKLKL
ncbi:hypothetical protein GQX74_009310 [Glossina fuscipes]|nr:hypothetical protein GQX74_009310 [Glossina fuscipes]